MITIFVGTVLHVLKRVNDVQNAHWTLGNLSSKVAVGLSRIPGELNLSFQTNPKPCRKFTKA